MANAFHGYSAAEQLRGGDAGAVRSALVAARERTLALADAYERALQPHAMKIPYSAIVNPPLWELGHIGWFQEYWIARNQQRALGVACDPGHARSPSLLERADAFYDSSRIEHRSRWSLPLPDSAGTRDYLASTLGQTLDLLGGLAPDATAADLYFFRLCALHEAMHAEAATYMARALRVDLPALPSPHAQPEPVAIAIPAQHFHVGSGSDGFAFDNELDAHPVRLNAYSIDAEPVRWSQFRTFVRAGGYNERAWWSDEGWAWASGTANPAPQLDAMHAEAATMHVTAFEAEAWCRWAGRRLPSEAEWECAALTAPGFSWGQVWEWTATDFQPYPGFQPHPYRDYSAPWFGTRRVLRGASPATAPSLAHPRYRNFFEPWRRDIFSGFRSCA